MKKNKVTDQPQDNGASDGTSKPVENYDRGTKTELRTRAVEVAAKYFMATSNDCVSLTNDILTLLEDTVREVIGEYESLDSTLDELAHDKFTRNDLKTEQLERLQRLVELKEQGRASSRQAERSPNTKLNNGGQ